ncbi:MAG: hypothetical protein AVDCRST_MAG62-1646, partial [uncultured Sphingomonas sp.]
ACNPVTRTPRDRRPTAPLSNQRRDHDRPLRDRLCRAGAEPAGDPAGGEYLRLPGGGRHRLPPAQPMELQGPRRARQPGAHHGSVLHRFVSQLRPERTVRVPADRQPHDGRRLVVAVAADLPGHAAGHLHAQPPMGVPL